MSHQIAVRLPDELVEFIDRSVEHGQASSRAAVVAQAIEWQRRREIAERDAAILASTADTDEFAGLAEFATTIAMDDLD